MQDNLGMMFTVGMIALFFVMDVLARRRNKVDEPENQEVREPAAPGAEPSQPVARESESDSAYLRRFLEASESSGAEEGEAAPMLELAEEEIRKRGRHDLLAVPATAPRSVDAPLATAAALRAERSRPARTRRAARLRAILHAESETLHDAVLFREILGRPLGSQLGPGGWQEPE
jgi:hypothetical protein